ncbi:MFS transporter [Altererythrobacter sp. CC-YST694]|uniref:MFS transporter n=1 Tax=Altererythrobacter sp. CC-YST694 TaxID=2755038 RepID=UPI001D031BE4|nr:MFS transporter [Altererythrobacter sp. CC-YST694]
MTGFFDSRRQMGVLAAATTGSVLSTTATVHAVFGTFLVPLSENFGWSRASISAVMAIIAISCAITYPLAGRYSDKHGSRRMILFGNVALGLSIGALALTSGSLAQFYLTFLAIGIFGALPSTAMFAKLVAEWFDRNRGTAMGFSSGFGNGLGSTIMPIVAAVLVSTLGWRAGYLGIAALILLVGFPVFYFLLHDVPSRSDPVTQAEAGAKLEGVSLKEAMRVPAFWLLMAAIAAGGGISTAILSHVVPIVGDRGFSLGVGTAVVSVFALSASAWQVASGRMLDKVNTPRIVVPMYALAIPGLFLLEYGASVPMLVAGGACLGLALGAQFGALPFFIARYFGLRHFGAILGVMYSAVIAGQGITPVLLDAAFDVQGSYRDAILVSMAVMGLGSLLLFLLPSYRGERAAPAPGAMAVAH